MTTEDRKWNFWDRYQVGDDCCGQVEWYARKADAISTARAHVKYHDGELEVTVFDRFARRNANPIVWSSKS